MLTVYTFGDSILDCANYNGEAVEPGRLIVKNDDRLFPNSRDETSRAKDSPSSNTGPSMDRSSMTFPSRPKGWSSEGRRWPCSRSAATTS